MPASTRMFVMDKWTTSHGGREGEEVVSVTTNVCHSLLLGSSSLQGLRLPKKALLDQIKGSWHFSFWEFLLCTEVIVAPFIPLPENQKRFFLLLDPRACSVSPTISAAASVWGKQVPCSQSLQEMKRERKTIPTIRIITKKNQSGGKLLNTDM